MWRRKKTNGFTLSSCFSTRGIINSIAFTLDENHIVVGGFSCPSIQRFNINSGESVAEYWLDGAGAAHGSISCGDDYIAVLESAGSVLKLLDTVTLRTLPFSGSALGHVEAFAFDSVSQRLLVGYRPFVNRTIAHNLRLFDRKGELVAEMDAGLNIYGVVWCRNKIVVVGSRRERQGRPQIVLVDPESGLVTTGEILATSRVDHVVLSSCNVAGLIFVSMRVNDRSTCCIFSHETLKNTRTVDLEIYTCRQLQHIPSENMLVALVDAGRNTGTLALDLVELSNRERKLMNRGASGLSLARTGNKLAIAFGRKIEVYDRE